MAFEVVTTAQSFFKPKLPAGMCSLVKSGALHLAASDVEAAKIGGRCVVLADPDTLRIALRRVRSGEEDGAATVRVEKNKLGKDTGRRSVNVGRAIVRLALEPQNVAGRYPLIRTRGDSGGELLIVNLTGGPEVNGSDSKQSRK